MKIYTGKTIWLVGASVGIGEALAGKLASAGAELTLSARSMDKLQHLQQTLSGTGHSIQTIDVTNSVSVEQAWRIIQAKGVPDIVIYNAGAYDPLNAKQFDLQKTEQMLDVNFHGALRVLHFIIPAFLARGSGHIVLVGSVAAYSGLPNAIGYGASKAALMHLAENLRVDMTPANITVQLVSPGFVKTRLTDKNTFKMPCIISADEAADHIMHGMQQNRFEIHFPKRFTLFLKLLRLLPYPLYFALINRMV